MERIKVLLIEDDEDSRELLAEILRADFDIATAVDGTSGWAAFQKLRPDVVVTDESIPGLRGTELADKIKAVSPETRVILVTGYGNLARTTSCDVLLKKPLDIEGLSAALRSFFPDGGTAHP